MIRNLYFVCIALPGLCAAQTVTDYDGNVYPIVTIGSQLWTATNIQTTHYADGGLVPTGCFPDGDVALVEPLGRLYTWAAATRNATVQGAQGVCPTGWHVPTDAEWMTLINEAGGETVAAGALKSTSSLWTAPNVADNSTGFSALPAGNCYNCGTGGSCDLLSTHAEFWTSTPIDALSAANWSMNYQLINVFRHYNQDKANGFSVRCLSNSTVGMEEHAVPLFRLLPNPTNGVAYMEVTGDLGSGAILVVRDLVGRELSTTALRGQRLLTIGDLPGGAYVVTVTDGGRRWQERLVIQ